MANINQKQAKALYAALPAGEIFNGQLNANEIWANLFNKITTQRTIRTFDFTDKFFARYAKKSSMYGDMSEVLSFGMARIEDWTDSAGEWIKDKYFVEAYQNIVKKNIDKQYTYTLTDLQMQYAFMNENTFGNALTEIRNSVEQQKQVFWYNTILDTYKNTYKNVIEIDVSSATTQDEKDRIILSTILRTIKEFTLPNTKFNVIPDSTRLKTNATPIEQQNFTWNLTNQVDFETGIARVFNGKDISNVNKLLSANFADFGDDSIVGVLDTDETIYLGIKSAYSNYQAFAKDRYTNFYYNEVVESGVIGFTNGVVFKLKTTSSGDAKK